MMIEPPAYLLIGHITADLTPQGRQPGGTVAYAARTAHSFGLRTAAVTSAAPHDPVLNALRPYTQLHCRDADHTTTYENIYTPEGRVQYVRGLAAPLSLDDIPPHWRDAPLVHLAPLTGEIDPQIATAFPHATVLLTLQGLLRRCDPDGRVHFRHMADLKALAAVDLVVLSEEDFAEAPAMEAELIGAVRHLVITRAERGGTYYHAGTAYPYTTPAMPLVHPTGAGDVFAAALLASLHIFDGDMRAALQTAAHLGAVSVTRMGLASAPTPEEVGQIIDRVRERAS